MWQLPDPVALVVMALATWRIAALFFFDSGPWDVFERLRYLAGVYKDPQPFWGKQLSCLWCCSLWSGLFCGICGIIWWPILLPFALSGAAMALSSGGRMLWHKMNE
jgi:hypothetical protein